MHALYDLKSQLIEELEKIAKMSEEDRNATDPATAKKDKIMAIGEIGLDYYYGTYDREEALERLESMRSDYPDAYIAVIREGADPVCVEEIRP